jgi:alpha-amylase
MGLHPTRDRPFALAGAACVTVLCGACKGAGTGVVEWCAVDALAPVARTPNPVAGATYELYVRSFQDTDGDGIGDLDGVTTRLDHLASLGVEAIWLMPVFESTGPAGYDVVDFDTITDAYGGEEALERLFEAATSRDMRVLLDFPLNQTGSSHPWFQAAEPDAQAPEREMYLWADTQHDTLRWHEAAVGGWYYAYFGPSLPDLDWRGPSVFPELMGSATDWLSLGAGGMRIDAAAHLIEDDGAISNTDASHCLLASIYDHLTADNPDAVLLSEAWADDLDQQEFYLGSDDRPQADMMLDAARYLAIDQTFQDGDSSELREILLRQESEGTAARMAGFRGSHDLARLPERVSSPQARRAWMVLDYLLPGSPVIYYGEELDLPDYGEAVDQDFVQRGLMAWNDELHGGFTTGTPWFPVDQGYNDGVNVAAQQEDPESMLRLVQGLAALRTGSVAVQSGSFALLDTLDPPLFAFERRSDEERVVVVVNLSPTASLGGLVETETDLRWLTADLPEETGQGLDLEPLAPYGYAILVSAGALDTLSVPAQTTPE